MVNMKVVSVVSIKFHSSNYFSSCKFIGYTHASLSLLFVTRYKYVCVVSLVAIIMPITMEALTIT